MAKDRKPKTLRVPNPHLALPAEVYRAKRYPYPHASDEQAMRSDWKKIGADFRTALENIDAEWDELDAIAGKRAELVDRLQSKYGLSEEKAQEQVDNWVRKL